jgi:hypothetical protein
MVVTVAALVGILLCLPLNVKIRVQTGEWTRAT